MPFTTEEIKSALKDFIAAQGRCKEDTAQMVSILLQKECHLADGARCTSLQDTIAEIDQRFHEFELVPFWPEEGHIGACHVWHGYIVCSIHPLRSFTAWPGEGNVAFLEENETKAKINATISRERHGESPAKYIDISKIEVSAE